MHTPYSQSQTDSPTGSDGSAILPTIRRFMLHYPELRRFGAFLVAGGLSAIVTITMTALLTELAHQPFLWAAVAGTEVGVLVNFAINDWHTFSDMAGHKRALPVRLVRFHVTCATGQTLILLLSLVLHDALHWRSYFAQALPIVFVTGVNFALHRFWTYRAVRVPRSATLS